MQGSAQDVSYHLEELSKSLVSDFKTEKGRKGGGEKRAPLLLIMVLACSRSDPIKVRSPSGRSWGYPGESCSQRVLQLSRAGPIWGARNDAVKIRS